MIADDQIPLLTELWNAGVLTTTEIGERLGTSKNAVIGKARRIGLPAKRNGVRRKKSLPPPGLPKLCDLNPDQCRFPIGDPREEGFGFCGKPVISGESYCAEHHAVTHCNISAARSCG